MTERFGRYAGGEYPKKIEDFLCRSERIDRAYLLGKKFHEGQTRKTTGEPYFNHCVEVAGIIESWVYGGELTPFVEDLICAALLHDTVEDTSLGLEEISEEFGQVVAFLVDGVSKFKSTDGAEGSDRETLKKVLNGYYIDPRVVLIKLADRIHNMGSLSGMPEKKQRPKAWETEEIYARLAEAMGMWVIMRDLRDASFPFLDPVGYARTSEVMEYDQRRDSVYIEQVLNFVQHVAESSGISSKVGYRLAGLRQIDQKRKKIQRGRIGRGYHDVSDVLSVGITVKSVGDCYLMLGTIRSCLGKFIDPRRSVDQISQPADNGYRVLREVVDLGVGAIEIVIMTEEMEEYNNWGLVSLIRKGIADLTSYRMKVVFTPDDEVRILPLGATGWDVAAAIGPELLTRMSGLKVDGRSWLLSMEVPHAVTVEVEVGAGQSYAVDRSWERASMPKTVRVLTQAELNQEYREVAELGAKKAMVFLRKRGLLNLYDVRSEITPLLSLFGCGDISQLLYRIGLGEIIEGDLDEVFDRAGVTKEKLGLTTVLVRGKDRPGVLSKLTTLVVSFGGNISRVVNDDHDGKFEIRMTIRGLDIAVETVLQQLLGNDPIYSEVLVV